MLESKTNLEITFGPSSAQIHSEFTNPPGNVDYCRKDPQANFRNSGPEIGRDYAGKNPLLLGVLKALASSCPI